MVLFYSLFYTSPCFSVIPTLPDDYPTITAAIGNATDGDTIFVRSGIYEEKTLEINKTVSLVGENANNTKIRLHPPYFPTLLLGRRL